MYLDWTQNDDYMRINDFEYMLKKLGLIKAIKNEKEINQLFKYIDTSGNKKVSYPEFCAIFTDKKSLGLDDGSVDEEYLAFIEELKSKMAKKKRTPKQLFYGMEDEFEGKIRQADFIQFFDDNRLPDDKKILTAIFEDCKKPGTKFLDFKKFFKRIEKELTEDKEKNADRSWVINTIKKLLVEQYEVKKVDYFSVFERFDSSKSGFWKLDDFLDFIESHQKKFSTPKGLKPSEKTLKRSFESIDTDEDGKISESEFFKSVTPDEYSSFLIDHYEEQHSFARRISFKLGEKNYEDLSEYLNT
jgi:Ca2+-binding EF-hand superfamily protein